MTVPKCAMMIDSTINVTSIIVIITIMSSDISSLGTAFTGIGLVIVTYLSAHYVSAKMNYNVWICPLKLMLFARWKRCTVA